MEEQIVINKFFHEMQKGPNNPEINKIINQINSEFSNSYILQYYIGHFYMKIHSYEMAEEQFLKCINLSRFFSEPYFELCDYYVSVGRISEAETLLMNIYEKKTMRRILQNVLFIN